MMMMMTVNTGVGSVPGCSEWLVAGRRGPVDVLVVVGHDGEDDGGRRHERREQEKLVRLLQC